MQNGKSCSAPLLRPYAEPLRLTPAYDSRGGNGGAEAPCRMRHDARPRRRAYRAWSLLGFIGIETSRALRMGEMSPLAAPFFLGGEGGGAPLVFARACGRALLAPTGTMSDGWGSRGVVAARGTAGEAEGNGRGVAARAGKPPIFARACGRALLAPTGKPLEGGTSVYIG